MKTKKSIIGLMASATLFTSMAPVVANADVLTDSSPPMNLTIDQNSPNYVVSEDVLHTTISSDDIGSVAVLDEAQQKIADAISGYYTKDSLGNIIFTATLADLMNLGLSQSDAQAILDSANATTTSSTRARGFVGLYINLGSKTRKMGGWAAAAYVTGYVGWYLKVFATTPATAGAAAVISASVGAATKYAVERGIKRISAGVNIPFISLSYSISTP